MTRAYRNLAYIGLVIVLGAAYLMLVPTLSLAQENDLSATIRAAILSDPEAANLSEAEIDAMVEALATKAQEEGVTAEDIAWRPQEAAPQASVPEQADTCGNLPGFLCALNESLGFSGGNALIPLWLFISSALLILILLAMIRIIERARMGTAPPVGGMYS